VLLTEWQIWLLLGLVLLLADIFLAGGASAVLLVLALATVGGMIGAMLGLGLSGQLLLATATGLAAIPFVLWFVRRLTRGSPAGTPADPRIANKTFEVQERNGRLGVYALGDFFPARRSDDRPLEPGVRVRIRHFEGIEAIVEAITQSESLQPKQ
jgi:membrane protein implicated in regulation of membrane protease activity